MERTFVEKILNAPSGSIVIREPDFVLSHDNSARIRQIFKRIHGENVYRSQQLVIVLDGNISGFTNAMAMEYNSIRDFVEEQRIEHFYDCDKGICHQVLAGLVKPGMLITGSDTHTATAGAFNCLACGINKTETAVLWKSGKMWFRVPETIKIVLKNRLSDGVFAKDLALWIMGILSELEVNGQAIEFHGDGVASLSIADRMTIANVASELGVVSIAFPPDDVLADYFGEPAVRGVWADTDATYARFIKIDLEKVFPLILNTVQGVIKSVDEEVGMKIQQGMIGACASGRLEDLKIVASVLENRKLSPGFQLFIVPASREIYLEAIADGTIDKIAKSGAVILGSSCGPCMSVGRMASAANSRFISTANSHYIGGYAIGGVEKYIASPATVAMTALRGELAAVINFQGSHFKCKPTSRQCVLLDEYDYRKSGHIWNYSDLDNIQCAQMFSEKLTYEILYHQEEEIKKHLFAGLDSHFAGEVREGDIMIVGENFGCGRLLKHVVMGLVAAGIRLIIAKSVDHNFYRMAINHGLFILINRELATAYRSCDQLSVQPENGRIILNEQEYFLPEIDPLFYTMIRQKGIENIFF